MTLDMKQAFNGSERQAVEMLENRLQMQIELNRQYDIEKAMAVAEQTSGLANYVKENKLLDKPEFKKQKQSIQSLYKQLDMTITSARNEVAEKLKQIQKSKQALRAYKS